MTPMVSHSNSLSSGRDPQVAKKSLTEHRTWMIWIPSTVIGNRGKCKPRFTLVINLIQTACVQGLTFSTNESLEAASLPISMPRWTIIRCALPQGTKSFHKDLTYLQMIKRRIFHLLTKTQIHCWNSKSVYKTHQQSVNLKSKRRKMEMTSVVLLRKLSSLSCLFQEGLKDWTGILVKRTRKLSAMRVKYSSLTTRFWKTFWIFQMAEVVSLKPHKMPKGTLLVQQRELLDSQANPRFFSTKMGQFTSLKIKLQTISTLIMAKCQLRHTWLKCTVRVVSSKSLNQRQEIVSYETKVSAHS